MKRYESYKDSGVQWIGEIPSHWDVIPFKYTSTLSEHRNDDGVSRKMLSVSQYHGIIEKSYESEVQVRNNEESTSYWVVEPNDLVINTMWLNYRGLGVSFGKTGFVSPGYRVYHLNLDILNPYFTHYLLRSDEYVITYTRLLRGIRPNSLQVSTYDFQHIDIYLPPLPEQEHIVSFLDEKTSKIDDLIKKKEQKIELLKEYRTSLINRVITKGLNPDVPMKDSGVEWIGEIPSHWKSIRIKDTGFLYGGLTGKSGDDFRDENNPNNRPFIPFTNIFRNTYISSDNFGQVIINDGESQNRVQKNDIFFLMSSEDYEDLGKTSILIDDYDELYLNSFCKGLRITNSKVYPMFLNYQLSGYTHKKLISVEGSGFTRINLRQDKLTNTPVILPPLPEQEQIVSYLDHNTGEIDSTISTEKKKIELLKEYRQSLISSVITGKIKVVD